ncbi:MAG: LysR family transcriptional regulator, partial [Candidatus Thioglobus sp.]
MIETQHLRLIHALYQQGSVYEAAEVLFITQSALSHQIKKLETLIGG